MTHSRAQVHSIFLMRQGRTAVIDADGGQLAYHLASPQGYQVWTSDVDGGQRTRVAAHEDYLFFGPRWSPDGEWLAYQGCLYHQDPAHDWSDLCLGRPDGSRFVFCRAATGRLPAAWVAAADSTSQRLRRGDSTIGV